jgi:serine/threonine-protein kinase
MWEKDLASRFGSTAFVPLDVGAALQDGDLKVIGQMSFGGLSAVYLCKNKNQETVVLKEAVVPMNADPASREKALDMFKRETHILKGLSHQHIARVLDHFVERGHDYLVLEHIDGLDLRAYVKEHGPQSERMILRWAIEIADILQYLHEQDPAIIHRDVTPDNLVIDRTGNLKLIDFGAANEFVGTATGTLIGKQAYIAPEQFRGKAVPQSDIYSLGCTLYYLATGGDPEALSESSLPDPQASAMPILNALIESCTQIELTDRLPSMGAVKNSIRARSEIVQ